MTEKHIDLLAISESRWQGNGITPMPSCTILHSGSVSSHSRGVAIILSPQARAAWEAAGSVFKPISDRIMYIRLKVQFSYITIFAVYAPTNPVSSTIEANQPSEDFYNELHSALANITPTDMVTILGDFNARVGVDSHTNTWHAVLGPHGVGRVNENGQRLLDFCATNKLLITNSWFQHKLKHQYTWYRNGDRSNPGHIIDYVLVSARFRSSVLDTCVYREVQHHSDHELVVSTFRLKIKAKRRRCLHPPPRQSKHLPSDSVSAFRTSLADAYDNYHVTSSSRSPHSVEKKWSSFKTALQEASNNLPQLPKKKEADWITDEVRNLSNKKKEAWLLLRDTASSGDHRYPNATAEYHRLRRLTKVAAEKARNAWWSARATEAEQRARMSQQLGHGGSLIRELRLLRSQISKPSSTSLLAKDKSVLSSDSDKLQRWAEHFTEVSNCCSSTCQLNPDTLPDITAATPSYRNLLAEEEDMSRPISQVEIQNAIAQLRDGKAPGADGISAELLKLGGTETIRWLTSLNRIKPRAEALLRENQCGFCKGRGCTDQLFSLRVIMEKAREYHRPLYICFVDLRRAYDSVNREALWSVLQHCYHLPPKLLNIIKSLHNNTLPQTTTDTTMHYHTFPHTTTHYHGLSHTPTHQHPHCRSPPHITTHYHTLPHILPRTTTHYHTVPLTLPCIAKHNLILPQTLLCVTMDYHTLSHTTTHTTID